MLEVLPSPTVELAKLAREEAIVRRADEKVGEALSAAGLSLNRIKDQKLYRAAGFHSFSAYSRTVWGFSKSHIYRMIAGALIWEEIKRVAPELLLLESHLRKLAPLVLWDPEGATADCTQAIAVVKELAKEVGQEKVTAKLIQERVTKQSSLKKKLKDKPGSNPLRSEVDGAIGAAEVLTSAMKRISKTLKTTGAAANRGGGEAELREALAELETVLKWIKSRVQVRR